MFCAHCLQRLDADTDRCSACARDPLLGGRYRLDRLLLEARDANSYRATRVEDGLLVRACVLKLDAAPLPATVLDIVHPALARIHEILRVGAYTWLIQAPARGRTLTEIAAGARERWRDPVVLLELIADIATALAQLHERGLTHAAISSETITVGDGDERSVMVLDPRFDAATHPCADVYALGLTLAQLLVGATSSSLAPPPGWREQLSDGALVALLDRMLTPNREQRITSATLREAVAGLLRVRGGRIDEQRSPPTRPHASKPAPRFMMIEPPEPSPRADSSKQVVGRTSSPKPRGGTTDVPVMRPEELSRELSQAHRACAAVEQRKRQQHKVARALVIVLAATIAALTTYIVMRLF